MIFIIFRNKKGQFASGFNHDDDWKERMSRLMLHNQNATGYKHTKEAKKNISVKRKGHTVSKETRRKISFKMLKI